MNPGFRINLVGYMMNDGSMVARGFMTRPDLPELPPIAVNAKFSPEFFPEPRGRGRSRGATNQADQIALLAHDKMARHLHPEWTDSERRLWFRETLWHRTTINPENELRAVRRHIEGAKSALAGYPARIMVVPDDPTEKPVFFAFENIAAIQRNIITGDMIGIDGRGWSCVWGMKKAIFGHIKTKS